MIRHANENYTWQEVDILPYKEDGTHFKSITRQTLLRGEGDLPVEWRYFEIGPGGHSTLEKHNHQHAVMILRGSGHVLVRDTITPIKLHDLIHIPPQTWHQFRADAGEELGFLCLVANDRDRPERPNEEHLAMLRSNPAVAEFIRV